MSDQTTAASTTTVFTPSTNQTYNSDIVGWTQMLNNFIEEVNKCQSGGQEFILPGDLARINGYNDALATYITQVLTGIPLDLPKTHGRIYPIEAPFVSFEIENTALNGLIRRYENLRDEIALSGSSRQSSKLDKFDLQRATDILAEIVNYVTNYIAKTLPVDLPASAPDEPVATGVHQGV